MRTNHEMTAETMTARTGPAPAPTRDETGAAPMTTSAIILLFVGLMIAMFMFSLNQTVLATALPTIVGELDGVDQMLWVSTAFMLASTIMMPVYGKIEIGRASCRERVEVWGSDSARGNESGERVERELFFFFSSRRRHTRSKRDWSSDVCSSDLDDRDVHVLAQSDGARHRPADHRRRTRRRRPDAVGLDGVHARLDDHDARLRQD